jgi:Predicted acyltransferases
MVNLVNMESKMRPPQSVKMLGSGKVASQNGPSNMQGVQYVRAIAVCSVALFHASMVLSFDRYFGEILLNGWLHVGTSGVDMFFVVSGLIITVVSLNSDMKTPRMTISDYFARRFARIMPFLWACILIYAAVRYLGAGKFEAAPYLNAMFLWPLGEVRPNVVWTLRHEALFYIIFAIAFLGSKRRLYVLVAWCLSPMWFMIFGYPERSGATAELAKFAFNSVNLEFGCGVILGAIYYKISEAKNQATVWHP